MTTGISKGISTKKTNLASKLLARGAQIEHLTPEGQSPLDGAILNSKPTDHDGHERRMICAGIMMTAGARNSIEAAVAFGDVETVRDTRLEDPERFETVVHSRLESGQPGLLALAVKFNRLQMLKLLLSFGLDPDDKYRMSGYENEVYSWGRPLWIAAGESQYEIAEVLLDASADPNGCVYACGDPVGRAYTNRDDKMKSLLLRQGGRIDIRTAALECDTSRSVTAPDMNRYRWIAVKTSEKCYTPFRGAPPVVAIASI